MFSFILGSFIASVILMILNLFEIISLSEHTQYAVISISITTSIIILFEIIKKYIDNKIDDKYLNTKTLLLSCLFGVLKDRDMLVDTTKAMITSPGFIYDLENILSWIDGYMDVIDDKEKVIAKKLELQKFLFDNRKETILFQCLTSKIDYKNYYILTVNLHYENFLVAMDDVIKDYLIKLQDLLVEFIWEYNSSVHYTVNFNQLISLYEENENE